MVLGRLGVLDGVEPVVTVLPDVELGTGDRLPFEVEHPPVHPGRASPAGSITMLSPYARSGEPGT